MSFDLALTGGKPWGFRVQGGTDKNDEIRISRINPGSKAAKQGLKEGDVVESINGQSTSALSNSEAHQLIRNALDRLNLSVRRVKKKSEPIAGKMYRSSTSIEVNSPTSETPGSSGAGIVTTPQSPQSTTIVLTSSSRTSLGKERSREEVVVDEETNSSIGDSIAENGAAKSNNPASQENTKKVHRFQSLPTQLPMALTSQLSSSVPLLPPPPGFTDSPPSSGNGSSATVGDVISPADEFRDFGRRANGRESNGRQELVAYPLHWESADGAELICEDIDEECQTADLTSLRPVPKPRKALSEGCWPIFAQSEETWDFTIPEDETDTGEIRLNYSEGLESSSIAQRNKVQEETVKISPSTSVLVHNEDDAFKGFAHKSRTRVKEPATCQTYDSVGSNMFSTDNSAWKLRIKRFANTVQMSVNSSSTQGSTGSSPCVSVDDFDEMGKSANKLSGTMQLSGLVKAEMEEKAALKARLEADRQSDTVREDTRPDGNVSPSVRKQIEKFESISRSGNTESMGSEIVICSSETNDPGGHGATVTDLLETDADNVFTDDPDDGNHLLPQLFIEKEYKTSKMTDELSPDDLATDFTRQRNVSSPRESTSTASYSDSFNTVIEKPSFPQQMTVRLTIRSSASTLSSLDSDVGGSASAGGSMDHGDEGEGAQAGGNGVVVVREESVAEATDSSSQGSSGDGPPLSASKWQVTEEGCFYLPMVSDSSIESKGSLDDTNATLTSVTNTNSSGLETDSETEPIIVVEVSEDGTRRVLSEDTVDGDIEECSELEASDSAQEDGSRFSVMGDHSDVSPTDNGDTTSQSSMDTVMTVLKRRTTRHSRPTSQNFPKPLLNVSDSTNALSPESDGEYIDCQLSSGGIKLGSGAVVIVLQSDMSNEQGVAKPEIQATHCHSCSSGTSDESSQSSGIHGRNVAFANSLSLSSTSSSSSSNGISFHIQPPHIPPPPPPSAPPDSDSSDIRRHDDNKSSLAASTSSTGTYDEIVDRFNNESCEGDPTPTTSPSRSCSLIHCSATTSPRTKTTSIDRHLRRSLSNTGSKQTVNTSLQTDVEESGTLDDLPSLISDEIKSLPTGESATEEFYEKEVEITSPRCQSPSSSASSSALGGSSNDLCGNAHTPEHTLTDISDIPSHYTNDFAFPMIANDFESAVVKGDDADEVLEVTLVNNQVNTMSIKMPTADDYNGGQSHEQLLNRCSSRENVSGYEELIRKSPDLSEMGLHEFDDTTLSELVFSEKDSDDTSKTLCAPCPVEMSSSDLESSETLGKDDVVVCADLSSEKENVNDTAGKSQAKEITFAKGSSDVTSEIECQSQEFAQNEIVEDQLYVCSDKQPLHVPKDVMPFTEQTGNGQNGRNDAGPYKETPLLEFEVELLLEGMFREFASSDHDEIIIPTTETLCIPSSFIRENEDCSIATSVLHSSADVKIRERPVPHVATTSKRTKLFSISMVQTCGDSHPTLNISADSDANVAFASTRTSAPSISQVHRSVDLAQCSTVSDKEFAIDELPKRHHSLDTSLYSSDDIFDRGQSPYQCPYYPASSSNVSIDSLSSSSSSLPSSSVRLQAGHSLNEDSRTRVTPRFNKLHKHLQHRSVDVANPSIYQQVINDDILEELMNQVSLRSQRTQTMDWERLQWLQTHRHHQLYTDFLYADVDDVPSMDYALPPESVLPTKMSPISSQIFQETAGRNTNRKGSTLSFPKFKAPGNFAVYSPGELSSSLTKEVTTSATTIDSSNRKVDTTTPTSTGSGWCPNGQPNDGTNKRQFRSVRLDPVSFGHSSQYSKQERENGFRCPSPPPAFLSSPPTKQPPAVPPKTLPIRPSLVHSSGGDNSYNNSLDAVSTATPSYTSQTHSGGSAANLTPDSSPPTFTRVNPLGSRFPPSQNPTVTLLQKAREGHIPPKGAVYIDHKMNSKEENQQPPGMEHLTGNWWDGQFAVKSQEVYDDRKVIKLEPVKYEGVGPVVKGVPISLCTGVKDENKGQWYKRMYQSLHRGNDPNGRYPYVARGGGYMSEPEPERDEDYYYRRSATLDRRKTQEDYERSDKRRYGKEPKKHSVWIPPSARYSFETYRNQPKKIEDYQPGHSSIAEMEAKMFWSEVLGIFDMDGDSVDQRPLTYLYSMLMMNHNNWQANRYNNQQPSLVDRNSSRSHMFKDGYESDSTLVYRKRGPVDTLSPNEQKTFYREFHKGGDIPLAGFRRPAPERTSENPDCCMLGDVHEDCDKFSPSESRLKLKSFSPNDRPILFSSNSVPDILSPPPHYRFRDTSYETGSNCSSTSVTESADYQSPLAVGDVNSGSTDNNAITLPSSIAFLPSDGHAKDFRENSEQLVPNYQCPAYLTATSNVPTNAVIATNIATATNPTTTVTPLITRSAPPPPLNVQEPYLIVKSTANDSGEVGDNVDLISFEDTSRHTRLRPFSLAVVSEEIVGSAPTLANEHNPKSLHRDSCQVARSSPSEISTSDTTSSSEIAAHSNLRSPGSRPKQRLQVTFNSLPNLVLFPPSPSSGSSINSSTVSSLAEIGATLQINPHNKLIDSTVETSTTPLPVVKELAGSTEDTHNTPMASDETEASLILMASTSASLSCLSVLDQVLRSMKISQMGNQVIGEKPEFIFQEQEKHASQRPKEMTDKIDVADILDEINETTEGNEQLLQNECLSSVDQSTPELKIVASQENQHIEKEVLQGTFNPNDIVLRSPTNKERLAGATILASDRPTSLPSTQRPFLRNLWSRSLDTLTILQPSSPQLDRAAYREYLLSFLRAPHVSNRFSRLRGYYGTLEKISQVERNLGSESVSPVGSQPTRPFLQRSSSVPELQELYAKLDRAQENREFLYRAGQDMGRIRWKMEDDRFLHYRCTSVQDMQKVWVDHLEKEKVSSMAPSVPSSNSGSASDRCRQTPSPPHVKLRCWTPSKKYGFCGSDDFVLNKMYRSSSVADIIEKYNKMDYYNSADFGSQLLPDPLRHQSKPWNRYSWTEASWQRKFGNSASRGKSKEADNKSQQSNIPKKKVVEDSKKLSKQPPWVVHRRPSSSTCAMSTCKEWPSSVNHSRDHRENERMKQLSSIKFEEYTGESETILEDFNEDCATATANDGSDRVAVDEKLESKGDVGNFGSPLYKTRSSSASEGSLQDMDDKHDNSTANGSGKRQEAFMLDYFSPRYLPERTQSSWDLSSTVSVTPFGYIREGFDCTSASSLLSGGEPKSRATREVISHTSIRRRRPSVESEKQLGSSFYLNHLRRGEVRKLAAKFEAEETIPLGRYSPNVQTFRMKRGLHKLASASSMLDVSLEKPVVNVNASGKTSSKVEVAQKCFPETDHTERETPLCDAEPPEVTSGKMVGKGLDWLVHSFRDENVVRWLFSNCEKMTEEKHTKCFPFLARAHARSLPIVGQQGTVSQLRHRYEQKARSSHYSAWHRTLTSYKKPTPKDNPTVSVRTQNAYKSKDKNNQLWIVLGPSNSSPNLIVEDFNSSEDDRPLVRYESSPDCLDSLSDSSYNPGVGWTAGFAVHDRNNNNSSRNKNATTDINSNKISSHSKRSRMPDITLLSPRNYTRKPREFKQVSRSVDDLLELPSTAGHYDSWPNYIRKNASSVSGQVQESIAQFEAQGQNTCGRHSSHEDYTHTYTYSPLISTTPLPSPKMMASPSFVRKTLSPNNVQKSSHDQYPTGRNVRIPWLKSTTGGCPRPLPSPPVRHAVKQPQRRASSSASLHSNSNAQAHLHSSVAATNMELDKVEFGFPPPPPKVSLIDPADPLRRFQESQVNIHFKSPIQNLEKEYISEEELRRRQEHVMRQFYEEERKKKIMQELADIENRRHNDNFIPSQKSPIPLNRYESIFDEPPHSPPRVRTPEPKTAGKALYGFTAQSAKELSFNKGDIIFIHRKIDKNWYEGEHHGLIGLFPVNHVEIIPYDSVRLTAKKSSEGQARAKYNFQAQTPMELSLVKGEHVILTRKVDRNWYEGRIGNLRGIFPSSYIHVITEPAIEFQGSQVSPVSKPVASPVSHSLIINGSAVSPKYSNNSSYNSVPSSFYNQRVEAYSANPCITTRSTAPARPAAPIFEDKRHPLDQTLHIHTQTDPMPYRAVYAYKPQNDDELELHDGDTVYVMEKCDDGWYVGSSQRTGLFGTFPGNYVERI